VLILQLVLQFLSPNFWIISKDILSLAGYPLLGWSCSFEPHDRNTCMAINQNCYLQSTQIMRTILILQKKRELIKTNQIIHLYGALPFIFAAIYFPRAIIT
jgi:hypothetical protein